MRCRYIPLPLYMISAIRPNQLFIINVPMWIFHGRAEFLNQVNYFFPTKYGKIRQKRKRLTQLLSIR